MQLPSYSSEMQEARDRVFAACRKYGIAFLEGAQSPELTRQKIDEGIRVFSGHSEENAKVGRAHSKRTMPV